MMLFDKLKSLNLNRFDSFEVSVYDGNSALLYEFTAYFLADFFRLLAILDLINPSAFGLHEGSNVFYLEIHLDYVEQCK